MIFYFKKFHFLFRFYLFIEIIEQKNSGRISNYEENNLAFMAYDLSFTKIGK